MSKSEILSELTANGNVNSFRRTPSWEKAFKAYNAVNKSHKQPTCTSCFKAVLRWLQN